MTSCRVIARAAALSVLLPSLGSAQAKQYALESTEQLRPHNVVAKPATLLGKKGV